MPTRQILASEIFLCRPTQTRYPAAPEGWVLLTRDGEQVTGAQLPAVCDAISRAWARGNQGKEALESARDWLAVARAAAPAERIEAGWVVYRLAAEALARGLDCNADALMEALSLLEALTVLRGGPSLRPRTVVPGAAGLLVAHTALSAAVREALANDPGLAAEGEDARVRSEW